MTEVLEIAPRAASPQAAPLLMVYVQDKETEAILRQCLSELNAGAANFVRGGVEAAISDIAHSRSPQLLVVDISGTADPAARLAELAHVCEPKTGVIVVGDVNDVSLYRRLKEAGVIEYFYKPLVDSLLRKACMAVLAGDMV